MNMVIAAVIFVALLAVSVAHFIWALGQTWPIRDEKLLAQTVVGFAGIERMPPKLLSLAVAIVTFAAGVIALSLADPDAGSWTLNLIALPLAAVFLARGAIGYTDWWVAKTPEPSFRFNDRRVYSPLCLLLGTGFIALVIMRSL